jgi:phosphate starvation-inducible protein PhoH
VVRHPLVQKVVTAYERFDQRRREPRAAEAGALPVRL